jgi:hypothetical protein
MLPGAGEVLEAFECLNYDRPVGMEIGMIPFVSIDRYADRLGVVDDEFWFFVEMIHKMDIAFVKKHKKKTKRPRA